MEDGNPIYDGEHEAQRINPAISDHTPASNGHQPAISDHTPASHDQKPAISDHTSYLQ